MAYLNLKWVDWSSKKEKLYDIPQSFDEVCDILCAEGYPNTVIYSMPDYCTAFIGVTPNEEAVYDYDLMVEYLMNDEEYKMSDEEACDFICFNDSFRQPGQPMIYFEGYEEEMVELAAENNPDEEWDPLVFTRLVKRVE